MTGKIKSSMARVIGTRVAERVSSALRKLLESKHLYQSVRVNFTMPEMGVPISEDTEKRSWMVRAGYTDYSAAAGVAPRSLLSDQEDSPIEVEPPIVKIYCRQCNRVEPFHVTTARVIGTYQSVAVGSGSHSPLQNYELSYRCQSCRGVPQVFLVRREGNKLTLCGRSPIEHVDVPRVIPKAVRNFYSSAIVAFQSGQVLAANFLLRTLIEQWMIQSVPKQLDGNEKIQDAYVDTLPEDFRSRFPTLRDMYASLSADIHGAIGSAELFRSSQEDLLKHFDARRLYEL